MKVVPAHAAPYLDPVRTLFEEYAAEIQVDLCFQGFSQELADLPGQYTPPGGRLFLALDGAELAGCVGLRPFAGNHRLEAGVTRTCEMKRLYVRPAFRGHGTGRMLAVAVIDAARAIGYQQMRLDTLAHMTAAIALYRLLGFVPIPPYRHNPLPGAAYFALDL